MENKQIEEYIENGQEIELLDKLNSYVIENFDTQCENLIKILIVLQEKARIDWMQPNQALVNLIIKVLPDITKNEANLKRFSELIKQYSLPPYQHLSYLNKQFIIGIEDDDVKIVNSGVGEEQLKLFQSEIKKLNTYFLTEQIKTENDYFLIIDLFYNCVEKLVSERKVILIEEALNSFRNYIGLNPKNYLIHFIRPYFTGPSKDYFDYYYHVPEPFYQQIFTDQDFSFVDFIGRAFEKNVDKDLVSDIDEMCKRIQQIEKSKNDRKLALYSNEMNLLNIKDLDRFLKLKSSEHIWVHKECLPPNYK